MRAALALWFLLGACASDGPHIESVMPEEGSVGDEVTLAGDGFCGAGDCDPLPTGLVSFGIDPQIDGVVTSWSDGEIRARVPMSVAPGEILIVVTVDGRSSNGVRFVVR